MASVARARFGAHEGELAELDDVARQAIHVAILAVDHPMYIIKALNVIRNAVAFIQTEQAVVFHLLVNNGSAANSSLYGNNYLPSSIKLHWLDRLTSKTLSSCKQSLDDIVTEQAHNYMWKPLLHHVLPLDVHEVILLDSDLLIMRSLADLWAHFDLFDTEQMVGLAFEQQPSYLGCWRPGISLPDSFPFSSGSFGFRGFNGGVQLLHLGRMRKHTLYNQILCHAMDWLVGASGSNEKSKRKHRRQQQQRQPPNQDLQEDGIGGIKVERTQRISANLMRESINWRVQDPVPALLAAYPGGRRSPPCYEMGWALGDQVSGERAPGVASSK
jgi:hypothetical protein